MWDAPVVAFVKSLQDGAAQGIAVQLRCVQGILEDLQARAPPHISAWSSQDACPVDPWGGDCSKASLRIAALRRPQRGAFLSSGLWASGYGFVAAAKKKHSCVR